MTKESYQKGESEKLLSLMNDFDCFHVRKPEASQKELIQFIEEIPESYHYKLVNHGHMNLWDDYSWRSAHFSARNPVTPSWQSAYSFSCHNISELKDYSFCEYLFLSPIFDSISKSDYKSNFPDKGDLEKELRKFKSLKPTTKIIALGGVTLDNEERLLNMGFDGVCIKGSLDFVYEKQ